MERLIPGSDSYLLDEAAKKCKDAKERERLRALYVLSIGYTVSEVVKMFCVDESTIYNWIARWQEEKTLADKPREGRPPSLDEKDKKEIRKLVGESDPKKHGVNASFWDCRELRDYFGKKGKPVSRETIRRCLKEMGARYVKAEIKYADADIEKQKEFARWILGDLGADSAVLFLDESSVGCYPRKGYGWTFEKRLVVKAFEKQRRRTNCFGAVNPLEGKITQMTSGGAKAPSFVRFLRKVEKQYRGKEVIICLDNLQVHKSKLVKRFLDKHRRIVFRFLPPYSPDMNPQEQWWNYQRRKFLNNRSFDSTRQLASSLGWFVQKTPSERVMSVCSLEPLRRLL